ncbi:hypothetical protein VTN96DRAFT_8845 [Rasamsonia emersonii]
MFDSVETVRRCVHGSAVIPFAAPCLGRPAIQVKLILASHGLGVAKSKYVNQNANLLSPGDRKRVISLIPSCTCTAGINIVWIVDKIAVQLFFFLPLPAPYFFILQFFRLISRRTSRYLVPVGPLTVVLISAKVACMSVLSVLYIYSVIYAR